MTPEEAIKTIELAKAEVEWNYPMDYAVAFEMAKEALERQMSQKPMTYNKYEHHCECGAIVHIYQNYCYDCGQALDWGNDE